MKKKGFSKNRMGKKKDYAPPSVTTNAKVTKFALTCNPNMMDSPEDGCPCVGSVTCG